MGATLDGFPDFFQYAVNALMASCPGASVGSGSRTSEEQAHLYATKGAWSPTNPGAARPGTSNHEVGVGHGAADMSGNLECLHAKAAQFGLQFPIANEPWHIEPSDALIEQGMEFFGMAGEAEEEQPDSLDGIRQLIYGNGPNPGQPDIPERVEQGLGEEEPAKPRQQPAEFVPQASAGFDAGTDGSLSAVDVARFYAQAGFTGDALVTMVAISKGESGWNPGAAGDTSITDGTWGPSLGLSQIRSLNDQRGTGGWRDADQLRDPQFNARAAYAISNGGTNFGPWTVYSKGIYQQYLEEARAAVSALGTGAAGHRPPPAASTLGDDDDALDPATLGLDDPAGISQEIAEMVLAQRSGTPDVLARLDEEPELEEAAT